MARKHFGPRYSEGARQLGEFANRECLTLDELASRVSAKITRTAVHRWMFGDRIPARRFAFALEQSLGIPLDAWDRPAKKTKSSRKAAP